MKKILIAPSILAADFSALGNEIKRAEEAGADMIHVDVMDGHFVPNITIGSAVVRDIRKVTKLPLDVHLMISDPLKHAGSFIDAGSDIITVHAESEKRLGKVITNIKSRGVKAGVSIKPKTGIAPIKRYLKDIDMVLIMTVEPGFGGQAFMADMLPKIRNLRKIYSGDIQVDGGIDEDTAPLVIEAGANILVAGTSVYKSKDLRSTIKSMKGTWEN
ncbi:MAG: ribulose-phosphate 3-epimerase [Candidatus Omnitrophica bacterium]|nr:ribulose-phosphate 3-epimerase [Candidatus Omnitrophota bacterium]